MALICGICAVFTAAATLRADSTCIAASQNGIADCGDEQSHLSSVGGSEDVEWNAAGSGRGDFQAFFKPSSYNPPETGTPDVNPKADSSWQFSGGGFSVGGCCGPEQSSDWSASVAGGSNGDPGSNDKPSDTLLSNILAPNGGGTFTSLGDPDPVPEPRYSLFLALGAGLLLLAGRRAQSSR